jgi:hypothetical protein
MRSSQGNTVVVRRSTQSLEPMADRFAYERAALANRAAAQPIEFSELCSLPSHVEGVAQHHAVYDGTIIGLEFQTGVLCDGHLVVEILGPFWDRVFRLELSGVTTLEASNLQMLLGPDLREIRQRTSSDGDSLCEFVDLTYGNSMTVSYTDAQASWSQLLEPLHR